MSTDQSVPSCYLQPLSIIDLMDVMMIIIGKLSATYKSLTNIFTIVYIVITVIICTP